VKESVAQANTVSGRNPRCVCRCNRRTRVMVCVNARSEPVRRVGAVSVTACERRFRRLCVCSVPARSPKHAVKRARAPTTSFHVPSAFPSLASARCHADAIARQLGKRWLRVATRRVMPAALICVVGMIAGLMLFATRDAIRGDASARCNNGEGRRIACCGPVPNAALRCAVKRCAASNCAGGKGTTRRLRRRIVRQGGNA